MKFSFIHNNSKLANNLVVFIFMSTIMLWDFKFYSLHFKYLILALIPFLIFEIYKDSKKIKYIYYSILIFILLFFHLIFSELKYIEKFNNIYDIKILKILYFSYISLCVLIFFPIIENNKKKFINFFIPIFLISTLISLFYFEYDAPYFCGGIPDYFNFFEYYKNNNGETIAVNKGEFKLSFNHFLYEENSHLGMVISPIIIYITFYLLNLENKFKFILYLISFFIFFVLSSTTLLLGLIINLLILIFIVILKKKISGIYKLSFLLIFTLSIFTTSSECTQRISSLINLYYKDILIGKFLTSSKKIENKNAQETNNKNSNGTLVSSGENLSAEVNAHAIKVLINSIKNKPFGYGFDNYYIAYNDYLLEPQNEFFWRVEGYNKGDGGNNFIKLFSEFGIFSLIIFIIIILYIFDKKIKFENKVFFVPFIITQFIRGAGYFNAGFSIILLMILIDYINTNYLEKKI